MQSLLGFPAQGVAIGFGPWQIQPTGAVRQAFEVVLYELDTLVVDEAGFEQAVTEGDETVIGTGLRDGLTVDQTAQHKHTNRAPGAL